VTERHYIGFVNPEYTEIERKRVIDTPELLPFEVLPIQEDIFFGGRTPDNNEMKQISNPLATFSQN